MDLLFGAVCGSACVATALSAARIRGLCTWRRDLARRTLRGGRGRRILAVPQPGARLTFVDLHVDVPATAMRASSFVPMPCAPLTSICPRSAHTFCYGAFLSTPKTPWWSIDLIDVEDARLLRRESHQVHRQSWADVIGCIDIERSVHRTLSVLDNDPVLVAGENGGTGTTDGTQWIVSEASLDTRSYFVCDIESNCVDPLPTRWSGVGESLWARISRTVVGPDARARNGDQKEGRTYRGLGTTRANAAHAAAHAMTAREMNALLDAFELALPVALFAGGASVLFPF